MSAKAVSQSQGPRWIATRKLVTTVLFLTIAILIEYVIIIYALNLGVKDNSVLETSFTFPGTDWLITLAISPLFHLVPIAVIIVLFFSWTYLKSQLAVRPQQAWRENVEFSRKRKETRFKKLSDFGERIDRAVKRFFGRIKSGLLKVKVFAYLSQRISYARATLRSAFITIAVFLILVLFISLLAYPQLIYDVVAGTYRSNPSLLNFIKNIIAALAPIGNVFSAVNNALFAAAPGFRNFVLGIATVVGPLTSVDNAGKYLAFQNIASWVSAFIVLFYGQYAQKNRRFRKK
jgi:hypothetical protein